RRRGGVAPDGVRVESITADDGRPRPGDAGDHAGFEVRLTPARRTVGVCELEQDALARPIRPDRRASRGRHRMGQDEPFGPFDPAEAGHALIRSPVSTAKRWVRPGMISPVTGWPMSMLKSGDARATIVASPATSSTKVSDPMGSLSPTVAWKARLG